MTLRGKKAFVGLSGGVDSAVCAALLKDAGADVVGVFIKGWYPPGMPCSWAADRRDAMRVAAKLHIPFHTLDASQEYKQSVLEYLVREYGAGRTPNPDIMCNRDVKFGAFWRHAKDNGADYVATGHYARVENGVLSRGISAAKDQSYFLWAVPKEALRDSLFPLGSHEKSDIRKLAERYGLPNAKKPDSQGICFLGEVSVQDFLKAEIGTEPGKALDEAGKEVGTHDGALLRTLGERIALEGAEAGPWFVIAKDIDRNELVVSREPQARAPKTLIRIESENWHETPQENQVYEAQYRYHGPRVRVTAHAKEIRVQESLTETPARGQSVVVYEQDRVVGGGIIA